MMRHGISRWRRDGLGWGTCVRFVCLMNGTSTRRAAVHLAHDTRHNRGPRLLNRDYDACFGHHFTSAR